MWWSIFKYVAALGCVSGLIAVVGPTSPILASIGTLAVTTIAFIDRGYSNSNTSSRITQLEKKSVSQEEKFKKLKSESDEKDRANLELSNENARLESELAEEKEKAELAKKQRDESNEYFDYENDKEPNEKQNVNHFFTQPSSQIRQRARHKGKCENLNIPGLTYRKVPGDGHCLYTAVERYLKEDPSSLRKKVALYLENNKDELHKFFQLAEGQTAEAYIEAVRSGKEWGSHVEIEVLMRLFKRPIIVIEPDGQVITSEATQQFKGEPIFIAYNGHNHYDAYDMNGELTSHQILQQLLRNNKRPHKDAVDQTKDDQHASHSSPSH